MSRNRQSKVDVAAPNIEDLSSFHLSALLHTVLLQVASHSKRTMGTLANTCTLQAAEKRKGEEKAHPAPF